jgi:hypothetical protein
MFQNSPQRRSRSVSRGSPATARLSTGTLSTAEISEIASGLLRGKKLTIKDPHDIAEIVRELDTRRGAALGSGKYLDAKRIGDLMDRIKTQLYESDRDALFRDNVRHLEQLHQEAHAGLDEAKRKWKEKRSKFYDRCAKEVYELQERHMAEHAELEEAWSDPSIQRKFAKRSALLLQHKAVEKYLVLAGQLEDAEMLKRANEADEKHEIQLKYQDMAESFEAARDKLITDQHAEADKMRLDQDLRFKNLVKDEGLAMEVCQKRIAATKANLDDQSDMGRFMAKKFKKAGDCILPVSSFVPMDDLPRLATSKDGRKRGGNMEAEPLQLPRLKMAAVKPRKPKCV